MNYSAVGVEQDLAKSQISASSDALAPRQRARIERDRERGYSVNVKQVVLAFAVEFMIIGLILTNNIAIVSQLPDITIAKEIQALLFPSAMAMVELARVPLAIAVRTQPSFHIKLAALLGVLCAVAVTSVSLIQIGNSTFNPRLEETHKTDDLLADLREKRRELQMRIQAADDVVQQRRKDRDNADHSVQALMAQLNVQPSQTCNVVTGPIPAPGAPQTTSQVCKNNPVLKTLNAEIAVSKGKLAELEAAVRSAESQRASPTLDNRSLEEAIASAEKESRGSVFQSQLHAYAAMLFRKAPQDVTDADVKTLEWYLIVIPSIAAAFSSTLIAMTAVRRVKRPVQKNVTIPDEAAAYLFGPLVAAIRQEAQAAVKAAKDTS